MNIFYYIFLLVIIIFLFFLGKINLELSPKKIKVYILSVVIISMLRYISLISLCIAQSSKYIYHLKPLIFSNIIIIPLLSVALIYINLRLEKIKFNISYIIGVIMVLVYIPLISMMDIRVTFDIRYGYIVSLNKTIILEFINLISLGLLLIINLMLLGKKNSNGKKFVFFMIIIFLTITEEILKIGGAEVFPYPIIGETLVFILSYIQIRKFKQ